MVWMTRRELESRGWQTIEEVYTGCISSVGKEAGNSGLCCQSTSYVSNVIEVSVTTNVDEKMRATDSYVAWWIARSSFGSL